MKSRRVIALLAAGILSMSVASCGGSPASSASSAPVEQSVEQTAESDPAEPADEQTAESDPAEPADEQSTSNAPAEEAVEQTAESAENTAEQIPEEEAIPEGSEINESELEDGTKSTEIIKPDGSIRLVLEAPDGSRTETDYDAQLYPQSKVVYDEEGSKKSETTFKYDENQLDMSWEYTTEYDESGNVAYTSETENIYPVEEGFIYGAEPASGPDTIYPDPTGKGYKYGTELLPATSETVVKDAQGEIVKTISIDNEKREVRIKYPDGSREEYDPIDVLNEKYERIKSIQINYYDPQGIRYKMVTFVPGLGRQEIEYSPDGSVVSRHAYDEDGNQIK